MITDLKDDLLKEIQKLPRWVKRPDDDEWLQELKTEYPDLSISIIRACRDYHLEKHPNKKHVWKTALRNWLLKDAEFRAQRIVYQRQSHNRSNGVQSEAEIEAGLRKQGIIK